MTTAMRPGRNGELRGYDRRRLAPMIEVVETRLMLDAGVGLIAGSVFFDANKNQQFDPVDTPLPNVSVELYRVGASTPTATATTDASGRYAFSGVAAGDYLLKQVAPANGNVIANRSVSDLYRTSPLGPAAINISIPDSDSVYVNYGGVAPAAYLGLRNVVDGIPTDDATGLLQASVGSAPGRSDLNASLATFCLDDLHRLTFEGGEQFAVLPTSISALTDGKTQVSADRTGRIAYLYNHFANASLTNIQAAGLQLAIWELIYDTGSTADFATGNFQSTGPLNPADQSAYEAAIAQATNYFNLSAGRSESALLLRASSALSGVRPGTDGYQSMIARAQFDFLNSSQDESDNTLPAAAISGYVYCDANDDGIKQATEPGIPAVVITLTGTNDLGQPVNVSTTTDEYGYYEFTRLRPGTYTITETQPTGYLDGKDTQGTPGTGQTGQDVFRNIVLGDQVNGRNNNFGEHLPAPQVTELTRFGIHAQPTQLVLHVDGQLDPVAATNPANYTLVALGKDQRLGTCDDRVVPIRAVHYDAAAGTVTILPAVNLNVHYHYLLSAKVAAASDCARPLEYTSVFGRGSLAEADPVGKPYPVPPMGPCKLQREQRVIDRAMKAWNGNPGVLPKKTITIPHRAPVQPPIHQPTCRPSVKKATR